MISNKDSLNLVWQTHYQVNTVLLTDFWGLRTLLACIARGIVHARKVLAEGLWSSAKSGKETILNSHLLRLLITVRMVALLPKLSHAKTILPAMQARTLYEKLSVTFMFVFPNKNPLGFGQFYFFQSYTECNKGVRTLGKYSNLTDQILLLGNIFPIKRAPGFTSELI